jgi:hypothetical protein
MQDHATRLVGLDGLVVTAVERAGEQLDLHVELLARATGCLHCGGGEVRVKERPCVRVSDLSDRRAADAAGAAQAPLPLQRLRAHVHRDPRAAAHPSAGDRALPGAAGRARGARCGARRGRAEERTSRYQVARAFAAGPTSAGRAPSTGRGGCRSMRLITVAVASWPPWCLTWTAAA